MTKNVASETLRRSEDFQAQLLDHFSAAVVEFGITADQLFNADPDCDLDYCANTARDMKIDVAIKNNFGFGGTNGSLVFKRAP